MTDQIGGLAFGGATLALPSANAASGAYPFALTLDHADMSAQIPFTRPGHLLALPNVDLSPPEAEFSLASYNLGDGPSQNFSPLALILPHSDERKTQNPVLLTLGTATTGTPLSLFAGAAVTLTAASLLVHEHVMQPLGEAAGEAIDRGGEVLRDVTDWAGEQWEEFEMPSLPAPFDLINWISGEVDDPVEAPTGNPSREKTPILPPPPTTPPAREPASEDPYLPKIEPWKPPAEPWTHPTPRPPRRAPKTEAE